MIAHRTGVSAIRDILIFVRLFIIALIGLAPLGLVRRVIIMWPLVEAAAIEPCLAPACVIAGDDSLLLPFPASGMRHLAVRCSAALLEAVSGLSHGGCRQAPGLSERVNASHELTELTGSAVELESGIGHASRLQPLGGSVGIGAAPCTPSDAAAENPVVFAVASHSSLDGGLDCLASPICSLRSSAPFAQEHRPHSRFLVAVNAPPTEPLGHDLMCLVGVNLRSPPPGSSLQLQSFQPGEGRALLGD